MSSSDIDYDEESYGDSDTSRETIEENISNKKSSLSIQKQESKNKKSTKNSQKSNFSKNSKKSKSVASKKKLISSIENLIIDNKNLEKKSLINKKDNLNSIKKDSIKMKKKFHDQFNTIDVRSNN